MKISQRLGQLEALRQNAVWRILCMNNACELIAFLQEMFEDNPQLKIELSVATEKMDHVLEQARLRNPNAPKQEAKQYINGLISDSILIKDFSPEKEFETVELSSSGVDLIKFIKSQTDPTQKATESRLIAVMHQLNELNHETDPDSGQKIANLKAQVLRIERQIERLSTGNPEVLDAERAIERAREIISISLDLSYDFKRVKEQFIDLNSRLRKQFLAKGKSKEEILSSVFEEVDLISESPEGKTFSAFWNLLCQSEKSGNLDQIIQDLLKRPFAKNLNLQEKQFLRQFVDNLLVNATEVQSVCQQFSKNLRRFVSSGQFAKDAQMLELLEQTNELALKMCEHVDFDHLVPFELKTTSANVKSLGQYVLNIPQKEFVATDLIVNQASEVSFEMIGSKFKQAEIDFRGLSEKLKDCLDSSDSVTIADIFKKHPAEQGFASIVGMVHLAAKHKAEKLNKKERVFWISEGVRYFCEVPQYKFSNKELNNAS